MVDVDTAALSKLADSGATIANGEEDGRGRDVFDKDCWSITGKGKSAS